jgi:methyl-accepting chemotaxis protein
MYLSFYITSIIATLFVGAVGLWGIYKVNNSMDSVAISSEAIHAAILGDMMHDSLRGDVMVISNAIEHADTARIKTVQNEIEEHAKKFQDYMSTVTRLTTANSSKVKEDLKTILPKIEDYISAAKEIASIASASPASTQTETQAETQINIKSSPARTTSKSVQTNNLVQSNQARLAAVNSRLPAFFNKFDVLETELGTLDDELQNFNKSTQATGHKAENLGKKTILIGSILATAGLILLAWLLTRRRMVILGAEPETIRDMASVIASGDLSEKITAKVGDSASLLGVVQTMQHNLRSLITQIQVSAESISSGAQQISAGNTNLSQRTEEQASSLEETASSMEQMASTVKQNAESAMQANKLAFVASEMAVWGNEVVGGVVNTMAGINNSSKKMTEIISVIDSIAFQTNILALNAAVEAARAGEQGRGFAVVASEVRNLAQRSAAAAKEIKQLIGESVEKVEGGTKLVKEAGNNMEEIVTAVKKVTDIVSEIAAASQEQSAGIDQVNNAITNMDEVTQQNAALVEQAAAAAASLEAKAQELTNATSQFRLGTDGDYRAMENQESQQKNYLNEVKTARAELPNSKPAKASSRLKSPKAKKDDDWEEF